MRRIWAYIITALTALILVGVSFVSVFRQSTFNIEYSNGTEITFRVENIDETGNVIEMGENKGAEDIAEIMAKRQLNPTIICESSGTQAEDALTMKKIYENLA